MHILKKDLFFGSVVILLLTAASVTFISCTKETTTQASIGDTNWLEVGKPGQPAFQNSWTNLDTTKYSTCAFRKDGQGYVYLKGTITGGVENTTIFTLPAGYRPSQTLMFDPYGGAVNSLIAVNSAGEVIKGVNFNTFASLDGIVFHADR